MHRVSSWLLAGLTVGVGLTALQAAEARKRERPPACPPARYLLADPLVVVEGSPRGAVVDLGEALVSIDDVCDPVLPKKYKGTRKGTALKVKWPACAGLEGKVRAKGRIVDDCGMLAARIKAKKFKRRVEAPRSVCGDGVVDSGVGEQCDPPQPGACDDLCGMGTRTTIGAEGGQARSADGLLALDVPAGALPGETVITIRRRAGAALSQGLLDAGVTAVYDLLPDGLTFQVPAIVTLMLDAAPGGAAGALEGDIAFLVTANANGIEPLAEQTTVLDGEGGVTAARGQLMHFSSVFTRTLSRIASIQVMVPPLVGVGQPFTVDVLLNVTLLRSGSHDVQYVDMTTSPNVVYTGAPERTIGQTGTQGDNPVVATVDGYRCGNTPGPAVVKAMITVPVLRQQGLTSQVPFTARFQAVMTMQCVGAPTTSTTPGVSTTSTTSSSTTTSTSSSSTTSTSSSTSTSTSTSITTTTTIPCTLLDREPPDDPVCDPAATCPLDAQGQPQVCRFSPESGECACVPTSTLCTDLNPGGEPMCGGACPSPEQFCGQFEPGAPCTCIDPCSFVNEPDRDPPIVGCFEIAECPPGKFCDLESCRCQPAPTTTTVSTTSTSSSSSSTTTTSSSSSTSSSSTAPTTSSSTSSSTTTSTTSSSSTSSTIATTTSTSTSTTSTTLTSGGRAVQLDFDTGPFPAGTVLCLDQILGGCVAAADACPNEHVHRAISITGVSGEFPDQNEPECGQGSVVTYALGCGPDLMPNCSSADVAADLTDTAVVPPSGSGESGQCSGNLDSSQTILGFSCSHDVVDVTEAHVHRGATGVNGPIVMSLSIGTGGAVFGTVPTSPTDVHELQIGGLYVDIHSSGFPDGSVRGQLASELDLNFPLEPGQEVPPVASSALGSCQLSVDPARTMGSLTCTHDVVNPTMAHIHLGGPGTNGPIAVDLGDPTSPIVTTFSFASDLWEAIRTGEAYVNVHSTAFEDGEIRGILSQGIFIP